MNGFRRWKRVSYTTGEWVKDEKKDVIQGTPDHSDIRTNSKNNMMNSCMKCHILCKRANTGVRKERVKFVVLVIIQHILIPKSFP